MSVLQLLLLLRDVGQPEDSHVREWEEISRNIPSKLSCQAEKDIPKLKDGPPVTELRLPIFAQTKAKFLCFFPFSEKGGFFFSLHRIPLDGMSSAVRRNS